MLLEKKYFESVSKMPGDRLPQRILRWEPEGPRRKGRTKKMDECNKTYDRLAVSDTRDRDKWRNLLGIKENHRRVDNIWKHLLIYLWLI
jgi:hypothetical protein